MIPIVQISNDQKINVKKSADINDTLPRGSGVWSIVMMIRFQKAKIAEW